MSADDFPLRVVGGPWPERIGCRARIVPPLRREYPWVGLPSSEVVVLIEGDPLSSREEWSCVLNEGNLAEGNKR